MDQMLHYSAQVGCFNYIISVIIINLYGHRLIDQNLCDGELLSIEVVNLHSRINTLQQVLRLSLDRYRLYLDFMLAIYKLRSYVLLYEDLLNLSFFFIWRRQSAHKNEVKFQVTLLEFQHLQQILFFILSGRVDMQASKSSKTIFVQKNIALVQIHIISLKFIHQAYYYLLSCAHAQRVDKIQNRKNISSSS